MIVGFFFLITAIRSELDLQSNVPIIIYDNLWSKADNPQTLTYQFKGVKFQIEKKSDVQYDVYLDDQLQTTINSQSSNLYTSKLFPYGLHTIQLVGTNEPTNTLISYWLSMRAKRIDIHQFDKTGNWVQDTTESIRIFSQEDGATAYASFKCSKIWIFGAKQSLAANMQINFGEIDQTVSTLRNDKNFVYYNELLYESTELPLSYGELKLTVRQTGNHYQAVYLTYVYILDEMSPNPVSDPISVSILDTSYSYFNCEVPNDNTNNVFCPNNKVSPLPCGQVCTSNGANSVLTYSFTGVRFQVFGSNGPNYGYYNVYVDDVFQAKVVQTASKQIHYMLQYTSEILMYGEHTIKIQSDSNQIFGLHKLAYWTSMNAKRINISDFSADSTCVIQSQDNNNKCIIEENKIGGLRIYTTKQADVTFTVDIKCSKFWIIGAKDANHGKFDVEFGTISQTLSQEVGFNQRYVAQIVYESPQFNPISSTLKLVAKKEKAVLFDCIYYIDEPELEIPISASATEFAHTGTISERQNTICDQNSISEYPCGKSIRSSNSVTVDYSFTGVKFQLFGNADPDVGRFSIYLDGEFLATINEQSKSTTYYTMLYSSDALSYGEHSIKITSFDKPIDIWKISYWVNLNAKRINASEFIGSKLSQSWERKADGTGGFELVSKTENDKLTVPFKGSRYWIIGTGKQTPFNIAFNNNEKKFTNNKDVSFTLIDEDEFAQIYSELVITTLKSGTRINCVYILGEFLPPTTYFTKSAAFSNTDEFTNTGKFSQSEKFEKTDSFTESGKFTKTEAFEQSSQFSKSDLFSQSEKFEKTDSFTESGKFTKSDAFEQSSQFSKSDLFSQTNIFSNSASFTDTATPKVVSFSKEVTQSKEVSFSEEVTQSKEVSFSEEVTQSKEVSFSEEVTQSKVVSFSEEVTQSKEVSFSEEVTQPKEVSFSEEVTQSKEESFSNEITKSKEESLSEEVTQSKEVSFSNEITQSKEESISKEVTQSKEESISKEVTQSKEESISGKISTSIVTSPSKEVSLSEEGSSATTSNKIVLTQIQSVQTHSTINKEDDGTGTDSATKGSKNKTYMIIGVVIGILVLIAIIILIIFLIIRKKRYNETSSINEIFEVSATIDDSSNNEFSNPLYSGNRQEDPFLREESESDM